MYKKNKIKEMKRKKQLCDDDNQAKNERTKKKINNTERKNVRKQITRQTTH